MSLHEVSDWAAGLVLTTISWFTRLVFGNDKLTTKQMIAFYGICGGVLWITNTFMNAGIIRSSVQLGAGLVIPSFITGIIGGSKKSEKKISQSVEKAVDNISDKVDDIADAFTGKHKKDEKDI